MNSNKYIHTNKNFTLYSRHQTSLTHFRYKKEKNDIKSESIVVILFAEQYEEDTIGITRIVTKTNP